MPSNSDSIAEYTINITNTAARELEEIYRYVKESAYEAVAHQQESLIIKRIRQLKNFPNGYSMLESKPPLRSVRAGRYRIIFLVDDKERIVTIAHVLHARRDIDGILETLYTD